MSGDAQELEIHGLVVGLFQENCWIVGSRRRGEACVIDPGGEPEEILALARDMGVTITRVLASHAHLDHILAAREIVQQTHAPFLLHGDDQWIAEMLPQTAQSWLGVEVPPPPTPDRLLQGGEDLEIAGVSLRILHTPGHTPGSVSLYAPEAHVLFSGDTLFRESIGRTDLPGGSSPTILASIQSTLFSLPDETRVLPGHLSETTIGHERAHNPFVGAGRRTH